MTKSAPPFSFSEDLRSGGQDDRLSQRLDLLPRARCSRLGRGGRDRFDLCPCLLSLVLRGDAVLDKRDLQVHHTMTRIPAPHLLNPFTFSHSSAVWGKGSCEF